MRKLLLFASLLAAFSTFAETPAPSPSLGPAAAPSLRARLMDLGGVLSNEGFKMRDRLWTGKLEPGAPQRLAVNLFRGNHYWFCAAADPEAKGLKVSVFGPDGTPLTAKEHGEAGLAAAGVTAETTGRYFVEVETAGGPTSDFGLLYLFK